MTYPAFNTSLMKMLCAELQQRIVNFKVIDCLPNDLRRFCLVLQDQNKHVETLFFSFNAPFIRFHLTRFKPTKSDSHHPLLAFLREAKLKSVNILQNDRILQLTFSTPQGEWSVIGEFFSKHPNYYLINADKKILFSLHPASQTHYQLPPPHTFLPSPPLWHNHHEVEQAYFDLEKDWKFAQEKKSLLHRFSKQMKSLERKEAKLVDHLQECEGWEKIQHEGDLIKSHFNAIQKGTSSIELYDWMTDQPYVLTLDPIQSIQEQMAFRYKRAKKLQAGKVPLSQQLVETRSEWQSIKESQEQLQLIETIEELTAFKNALPPIFKQNEVRSESHLPALIYKEYQSIQGVNIWVGKNAKANEQLTFQLAKGRDWWVHVRGYSGSHVIIRMHKDQEPDAETLKDAFQLALYNSKARSQGEGEICFTQRKYVSRLGQKKVGLVQVSKHQTAWVRLNPQRLQALKKL